MADHPRPVPHPHRDRPSDLTPTEIGFAPQPSVRWLNPGLLAGTAVRVLLAHQFGSYLDKRELQAVLPGGTHDHTDGDELWLDYTADVGDGFDATYSLAHQLAQPELDVAGAGRLPRGAILVLGGDQVYPTASVQNYENRWKGPYRAAQPDATPDSSTLYALPGNHDWYDGLTAFLRLFAQGDTIGGWRTRQSRSYFALHLPHRWRLFAIDTQLDAYIDKPQLEYFADAAQHLGPDDHVIVCSARPAWVMTRERPDAYDGLDYFIRTVIEPTGARVPLLLAGDLHHYARYAGPGPDGRGRQLVTAGGGGAYLVGTAHLPDRIGVPAEGTTTRAASTSRHYDLAAAYPTPATTRRLGWRVFTRLPWRNQGFVALVGLMQTLLMLAITAADGRAVTLPVVLAAATVLAGTVLFATVMGERSVRHWVAGLLHAIPHLLFGVAATTAWTAQPLTDLPPPWPTLLAFVVYLPVVGLLDTWIVCAYLLLARYAGVNVNELYAGLGIEGHKSFLRMHIDRDGTLTLYPVTVESASRRWQAAPDAAPGTSWIVPAEPITSGLAEPPVRIERRTAAGDRPAGERLRRDR